MNRIPSQEGADRNYNPAAIVEGRNKIDMSKKIIAYGAYAEVQFGTQNNIKNRSIPGISLEPSNDGGGYQFMSLYTGQRINNFEYKELPITDELIERVEELVELEKQPVLTGGVPTFEQTRGVEIEDLDGDENESNQQET